jgi:uncharacterized protein
MSNDLSTRLSQRGPKRLLALDGGGIRGLVTLGYLKALESLLRTRYGKPHLVLCDYFDVIGGTSTGSLIATLIALGRCVSEIEHLYVGLAGEAFKLKNYWGFGAVGRRLGSKFDTQPLEKILHDSIGDARLESQDFRSGLMIVVKRVDTASVWPIVNFPAAKYFQDRKRPDGTISLGNRHMPVWEILRASTAAPTYFQAKHVDDVAVKQPAVFLDGGVSAHNNPALLLLMAATLDGFGLGWSMGADQLLLCSMGTGGFEVITQIEALSKYNNLDWAQLLAPQLVGDSMELVETILQWMSNSPTARQIDSLIGRVEPTLGGEGGLIHYVRYNVRLDSESLRALGLAMDAEQVAKLHDMDNTAMIPQLMAISSKIGAQVADAHFPRAFDPIWLRLESGSNFS